MPRHLTNRLNCFCVLLTLMPAITEAATCSINNVNSVNFGNYDVFSGGDDISTGRIRVQCNATNANYTIALDGGLHGTVSNRKMTSASGNTPLSYNLYTDPSNTIVWGNATGGGVLVNGNGNNNYTVYGKIPPAQDVNVGNYQDTVTVTVAF